MFLLPSYVLNVFRVSAGQSTETAFDLAKRKIQFPPSCSSAIATGAYGAAGFKQDHKLGIDKTIKWFRNRIPSRHWWLGDVVVRAFNRHNCEIFILSLRGVPWASPGICLGGGHPRAPKFEAESQERGDVLGDQLGV